MCYAKNRRCESSRVTSPLPERILGNTSGLLHERVFKNLLSVDLLLQSAASNEPVNHHSLLLSDAVYSV